MATVIESVNLLSAEDILSVDDLEYEDVPIPEWKGTVRISMMSADRLVAFDETMSKPENKSQGMFLILFETATDASGNRLFTTPEQFERLKKKNLRVLNKLQLVAMKINMISVRSKAELKNDSGEVAPVASPSS